MLRTRFGRCVGWWLAGGLLCLSACSGRGGGSAETPLPAAIDESDLPPLPSFSLLKNVTVKAGDAPALPLRYGAGDGQPRAYAIDLQQKVDAIGAGAPAARAEAHLTARLVERRERAADGATTTTRVQFEEPTVALTPDLPEAGAALREALQAARAQFTTDARGQVLNARFEPAPTGPSVADPQVALRWARAAAVVLPEAAVTRDVRWDCAAPGVAPSAEAAGDGPAAFSAECVFRGLADVEGHPRPLAYIEVTGRQQRRGPVAVLGVSGQTVSAGRFAARLLFDAEQGALVRSEVVMAGRSIVHIQSDQGPQRFDRSETVQATLRASAGPASPSR